MFYAREILSQQSNGRFSIVWLAATHSSKLRNRDFLQVDVPDMCDDIISIVSSASERPRFSLYLSSQLMFGICVVYQRQVKLFIEESANFFLKEQKHLLADEKADQPRRRILKKIPPGTRRSENGSFIAVVDDRQLAISTEELIFPHSVQDVRRITLPDEVPSRLQEQEQDFEMFPPEIVVIGDVSTMLRPDDHPTERADDRPSAPLAAEVIQPPLQTTGVREVPSPLLQPPVGEKLPSVPMEIEQPSFTAEGEQVPVRHEAAVMLAEDIVDQVPHVSIATVSTGQPQEREVIAPEETPGEKGIVVKSSVPTEPEEHGIEEPEAIQAEMVAAETERIIEPAAPRVDLRPIVELPRIMDLEPAPVVPRRRRPRRVKIVDRNITIPSEDIRGQLSRFQDTMRAQSAKDDIINIKTRDTATELLFINPGIKLQAAPLKINFGRFLQSSREPASDLDASFRHIRDEEELAREPASGSSSAISTPEVSARESISKPAPMIAIPELEAVEEEQGFPTAVQAELLPPAPSTPVHPVPEVTDVPDAEKETVCPELLQVPPEQFVEQAETTVEPAIEEYARDQMEIGPTEEDRAQKIDEYGEETSVTRPAEDSAARISEIAEDIITWWTEEMIMNKLRELWAVGNGRAVLRDFCPVTKPQLAAIIHILLSMHRRNMLELDQDTTRSSDHTVFILQVEN